MTTIKVKPTDSATQGPFVIINKDDFDPAVHEPYGEDDQALAPFERPPTLVELLAVRDQLRAREIEIDAERERVSEQARANDAETQRLAEMRAALEAQTAAEGAGTASDAAPKAVEKTTSKK